MEDNKYSKKHFYKYRISFSNLCTEKNLRMIPTEQIIESCLKDIGINASFSTVVSNATLQVSNQITKDILHSIVTLYTRVCSFSHEKDTGLTV